MLGSRPDKACQNEEIAGVLAGQRYSYCSPCMWLWYNRLRNSFLGGQQLGTTFAHGIFIKRQRSNGLAQWASQTGDGDMIGVDREQSYSILVADDDHAALDTMRDIIDPLGYRTYFASDGAEALDIVRAQLIHVALFDVQMPKLTGLETLQMIRQFNMLLPVILITADSNAGLMRQAFQAQAYSVLPKPVNKNLVRQTLISALGKAYGEYRGDRQ
jgi:two-component system, response regulator PdtaR